MPKKVRDHCLGTAGHLVSCFSPPLFNVTQRAHWVDLRDHAKLPSPSEDFPNSRFVSNWGLSREAQPEWMLVWAAAWEMPRGGLAWGRIGAGNLNYLHPGLRGEWGRDRPLAAHSNLTSSIIQSAWSELSTRPSSSFTLRWQPCKWVLWCEQKWCWAQLRGCALKGTRSLLSLLPFL